MIMERLPRYRHLVGFRHERVGESLNDFAQLQKLFAATIPDQVREFLTSLSDCVLYYGFDAQTRSGKARRYSHFVTTNVGPELDGVYPFPASLIGKIIRYRGMGLPDGYLPLMMDSAKTGWIWCDLTQGHSAVVVPKGTREFGLSEREWTVLAPGFDDFVQGMRLDVSPHLQVFRIAGTGNVQPSMREWFVAVMGDEWESRVQELIQQKRPRSAEPGPTAGADLDPGSS
jgi:hypothetical protein